MADPNRNRNPSSCKDYAVFMFLGADGTPMELTVNLFDDQLFLPESLKKTCAVSAKKRSSYWLASFTVPLRLLKTESGNPAGPGETVIADMRRWLDNWHLKTTTPVPFLGKLVLDK